jgi:hypothetical protein
MLLVLILALGIGYVIQSIRLARLQRAFEAARRSEALSHYVAQQGRVEALAVVEKLRSVVEKLRSEAQERNAKRDSTNAPK